MLGRAVFITSSGKCGGSTAAKALTQEYQGVRLYGGKAIRLVSLLCNPKSLDEAKVTENHLEGIRDQILQKYATLNMTNTEGLEKALLENPLQFMIADVPEQLLDCVQIQEFFRSEPFYELEAKLHTNSTSIDKQIDYATLCATLQLAKEGRVCFVESKSLNSIFYNFRNGLYVPNGWEKVLSELDGITQTVFLTAPLEIRAQRSLFAKYCSMKAESIAIRPAEVFQEMTALAKRTFVDALRYFKEYKTPYPATQFEQDIAIAAVVSDQEKIAIANVEITPPEVLNQHVIETTGKDEQTVANEIATTLRLGIEISAYLSPAMENSPML